MKLILSLLITLISACSVAQNNDQISIEKFTKMAKDKNFKKVIIDVRTPSEWKKTGGIKNAIFKNLYDSDALNFIKKLDKKKEYVIYCKSGGRSQRFVNLMLKHNLKVLNLSGGIDKWMSLKKTLVPYKKK